LDALVISSAQGGGSRVLLKSRADEVANRACATRHMFDLRVDGALLTQWGSLLNCWCVLLV
jgi:hypothetical protein